jgi:hypothetical protein
MARRVWAAWCGLLGISLGGCAAPEQQAASLLTDKQLGVPYDSTTNYFPANAGVRVNQAHPGEPVEKLPLEWNKDCQSTFEYGSRNLRAFKAPVLSVAYLGHPVYRFLWLRSFHRPALLTLEQTESGGVLRTQFLSRDSDWTVPTMANPEEPGIADTTRQRRLAYVQRRAAAADGQRWLAYLAQAKTPVQVLQAETKTLSAAQMQQFKQMLTKAAVWQLPTCQPDQMLDGADWILELHESTRYQVVYRHSPKDGIRQCCEFLLNLSPARKEERY